MRIHLSISRARRAGSLVCLALYACIAIAQAGSPANIQQPQPDVEGNYFVGPMVTAPRIAKAMAAGYPSDVPVKQVAGFTVLSMVIGVDGKPKGIEVLHTHGDAFDAAAIAAVKQSKFVPGMLTAAGGPAKPLPVRIDVRVPFHANFAQAVPVVVIAERDLAAPDLAKIRKGSYTPPIPIHMVDADFVDPTVKATYESVAIVTVDVSAEGLPTQVRLRRGLGFDTDAKAVAAVKQYRFLPATKKGQPVAASREVEVKFAVF